ncbi:MAG: hypothetical protein MJ252_15950, partial [archaeon]|nr:hypothetical protein [archaeon]
MGNSQSNSTKGNSICCRCPKTKDMKGTISVEDNNIINSAIIIQKIFRGYIIRKLLNMTPQSYASNARYLPLNYSTSKFDNNPLILKLQSYLPKFHFNDKERFYFKVSSHKKTVAVLFEDGSIYKGSLNTRRQKDGYGKLYSKDNTIYEGFFSMDYMEGHGRLYSVKEKFVYDGEFSKSMFHGFGQLMTLDGLSYKGYWLNDKQNGPGEEHYADGSFYIGNFINGEKNEKGKLFWPNGNSYEGEFSEGDI